ncbi:hypothetical protein EX30DRAFT_152190 [Ascodesmis nigricans]|uniref:Uncharacterized protein n=1 Tax=Ascodesmis nigricans TaxID=341454 RepID=A0A4S2N290_9PEZI|nr:hypothetical protein EX30DRAFT_152190 [Ascodesmis nigricans]
MLITSPTKSSNSQRPIPITQPTLLFPTGGIYHQAPPENPYLRSPNHTPTIPNKRSKLTKTIHT